MATHIGMVEVSAEGPARQTRMIERSVPIAARCLVAILLTTSFGCTPPRATVDPSALDCAAQVGASDLADGPAGIDRACLRLGPIALGMSREEVEKTLGRADLESRDPATCTNAVYVLNRDLASPSGASGRAVANVGTLRVVYLDDRVAAVEAQGIVARKTFGFGRVRIGDGPGDVRRAFGPPHAASGQVWSYQPVLFLLDGDNQTVEAIAVSETEDAFACLLPATLELSCDPDTGAPRVAAVRPSSDGSRPHGRGHWPGTIIRRGRTCKR